MFNDVSQLSTTWCFFRTSRTQQDMVSKCRPFWCRTSAAWVKNFLKYVCVQKQPPYECHLELLKGKISSSCNIPAYVWAECEVQVQKQLEMCLFISRSRSNTSTCFSVESSKLLDLRFVDVESLWYTLRTKKPRLVNLKAIWLLYHEYTAVWEVTRIKRSDLHWIEMYLKSWLVIHDSLGNNKNAFQ